MKPPGKVIGERLLAKYATVTGVGDALGMQRVAASALVNGRAAISFRTALRLEKLGFGDARDWLILQLDYDLERERSR